MSDELDSVPIVAFEGHSQRCGVLCGKSGKRDGQVKSHRHIAIAAISKAIHLLVRLFASFSRQNLGIFERRGINRTEPVTAKYAPGSFHQSLTYEHDFRKEISKALEGSRLNQIRQSGSFH